MASAVGSAARAPAASSAPVMELSRCSLGRRSRPRRSGRAGPAGRPAASAGRGRRPGRPGTPLPASQPASGSAPRPGSGGRRERPGQRQLGVRAGLGRRSSSRTPCLPAVLHLRPARPARCSWRRPAPPAPSTLRRPRSTGLHGRPRAAPGRRSRAAGSSASRHMSHSGPTATARVSGVATSRHVLREPSQRARVEPHLGVGQVVVVQQTRSGRGRPTSSGTAVRCAVDVAAPPARSGPAPPSVQRRRARARAGAGAASGARPGAVCTTRERR